MKTIEIENLRELTLPIDSEIAKTLHAGEYVLLTGEILTARDAAHKRIYNTLQAGVSLPFSLIGETLYYAGPCFAADGKLIAAGPTTSARMDAYAPYLYDAGVIATIGKGDRSVSVYDAVKRNGGLYFAAIGGAGAVYAERVDSYETVCYSDLGTEAVRRLSVKKFPVIVAIDSRGNSVFSKTA